MIAFALAKRPLRACCMKKLKVALMYISIISKNSNRIRSIFQVYG